MSSVMTAPSRLRGSTGCAACSDKIMARHLPGSAPFRSLSGCL